MDDLNTILSPDAAVVMRAVWESVGWVTIDEILEKIWQDGFSREKVRRLLRELALLNVVSVKKHGNRNYYAQRIGMSQYYPDLYKFPAEFMANETIELKGSESVAKMKKLKKMVDDLSDPKQFKKSKRKNK